MHDAHAWELGVHHAAIPAPGGGTFAPPFRSGIFVQNTGQLSPLTVLFSNPPNYRPPYSEQASLGIEREITPGFSVSVSFIYSHTLHLPVAIDTNLFASTPMSTVTLANGKTTSYRNWNMSAATDPAAGFETSGPGAGGVYPCAVTLNGFGQPVSPCFVNVLITQNNQYTSASSGLYEGGIIEVHKRFSDNFSFFGNYTYSKAFDTGTDFNTDFGPQDPTDLALDRALSEFDERNKVVAGRSLSTAHGRTLSCRAFNFRQFSSTTAAIPSTCSRAARSTATITSPTNAPSVLRATPASAPATLTSTRA